MTRLEQLLIRACKSTDPHKRVQSVYRRFYTSYGSYEDHKVDVASILASIADKYVAEKNSKMISLLAPQSIFTEEIELTYWDRALKVVISQIRLAKATNFPGLTPPLKLRKINPGLERAVG